MIHVRPPTTDITADTEVTQIDTACKKTNIHKSFLCRLAFLMVKKLVVFTESNLNEDMKQYEMEI